MSRISRRSIQAIAVSAAASTLVSHRNAIAQAKSPEVQTMTTTIAVDPAIVTLVTVLTVDPANQPMLLALLRDNSQSVITTLKGWVSTTLIAGKDKQRVVIYSQWRSAADVDGMRADPRMVAYYPRIAALATLESIVGDVDTVIHPKS